MDRSKFVLRNQKKQDAIINLNHRTATLNREAQRTDEREMVWRIRCQNKSRHVPGKKNDMIKSLY